VKDPILYRFSNIDMIKKVADSYQKVDYTDGDCDIKTKLVTSSNGNARNV